MIPVYNEEPACRRCSSGFIRRSTRWAQPTRSCSSTTAAATARRRAARAVRARPDVTRVILFNANFGQHLAIMAGFEHAAGDASSRSMPTCRTRPRKSALLVEAMDRATTTSASIRRSARTAWRRWASRAMNRLRERLTAHRDDRPGLHVARLQPQRGRQLINQCSEINTFIPALAYTFARNPAEVEVGHEERAGGRVEVFAVQADAAQLRPGDRLLAGAAAGVLDARHRGVAAVGRCCS